MITHTTYKIRGFEVFLDRDIAKNYGLETRNINRIVKRNPERFPPDFCFRLTVQETVGLHELVCQNGTASSKTNFEAVKKDQSLSGTAVPGVVPGGVPVVSQAVIKERIRQAQEAARQKEVCRKAYAELALAESLKKMPLGSHSKKNKLRAIARAKYSDQLREIEKGPPKWTSWRRDLNENYGGPRMPPVVFTKAGLYMILALSESSMAIEASIALMNSFARLDI